MIQFSPNGGPPALSSANWWPDEQWEVANISSMDGENNVFPPWSEMGLPGSPKFNYQENRVMLTDVQGALKKALIRLGSILTALLNMQQTNWTCSITSFWLSWMVLRHWISNWINWNLNRRHVVLGFTFPTDRQRKYKSANDFYLLLSVSLPPFDPSSSASRRLEQFLLLGGE